MTMHVDIPGADDPRVYISIGPIPVKGHAAFTVKVPRYDFMTEDQFDEMMEGIDKANAREDLTARKRGREVALSMLSLFTSKTEQTACAKLTVGQLDAIIEAWNKGSSMSLGEFVASNSTSEENSERPSNVISSAGDGADETSAPDSAGPN